MELMEKVSYLKGLVDMAEFDPSSKETKVLNAMLEVLDEMAKTVQSLTEANAQMCDVIESIDEDLSQVEEDLYAVFCGPHLCAPGKKRIKTQRGEKI